MVGQQNIFPSVSRDHWRESRPQSHQTIHQLQDSGQATASHTTTLHHSADVGDPAVLLLPGCGQHSEQQ